MKKPTKKQALLDRLNDINAALAQQHAVRLKEFAEHGTLVESPRWPQRLAENLSRKFSNMRVMLEYQSGNTVLTAAPRALGKFTAAAHHDVQYVVDKAQKVLDDGAWPAVKVMSAFAEGFDDGGPDRQEMTDLRAENARLKERRQNDVRPMMMMPGGYGMFGAGGNW